LRVDECANFKITHFFKKKYKMVEPTCELIKQLKDKNLEIKLLRMENAGENRLLKQDERARTGSLELNLSILIEQLISTITWLNWGLPLWAIRAER
jgi:hypothetical protein